MSSSFLVPATVDGLAPDHLRALEDTNLDARFLTIVVLQIR